MYHCVFIIFYRYKCISIIKLLINIFFKTQENRLIWYFCACAFVLNKNVCFMELYIISWQCCHELWFCLFCARMNDLDGDHMFTYVGILPIKNPERGKGTPCF